MKAKQMLCKAPVVRAMLDGRQTQDRRPLNFPIEERDGKLSADGILFMSWEDFAAALSPYQPGDIIWVRETGAVNCAHSDRISVQYTDGKIKSFALPERFIGASWVRDRHGIPNGIFKEAARIFLKVTAVRVERIRDISEADALAEGIEEYDGYFDNAEIARVAKSMRVTADNPRATFACLWESIYPGSWERNDWVWVTEFERCDKPAEWPGN